MSGVGLRERAERNWAARRRATIAPVTISVGAETTLDYPADTVWEFLSRTEAMVILQDDVTAAFWVPETPAGEVGGVLCVLVLFPSGRRAGALYEVVETGPGLRSASVCLSSVMPFRSESEVIPVDERSCVFRFAITTAADPSLRSSVADEQRKDIDLLFKRVREALNPEGANTEDGPVDPQG